MFTTHSFSLSLSPHPPSPKHPTVGLHRAEDMTRDVEAKEMLLTRVWDARPSLVSCWLQARSPSFHATAATGWSGFTRSNCPAHHILEPSPQSPDTLRPGIEADQPDGTFLLPCASPHGPLFSSSFHIVLAGHAVASRPIPLLSTIPTFTALGITQQPVEMIDTLSHSDDGGLA